MGHLQVHYIIIILPIKTTILGGIPHVQTFRPTQIILVSMQSHYIKLTPATSCDIP